MFPSFRRYRHSHCEPYAIAIRSNDIHFPTYNIPVDTIFYMASSWDSATNDYVREHLQDIQAQLSALPQAVLSYQLVYVDDDHIPQGLSSGLVGRKMPRYMWDDVTCYEADMELCPQQDIEANILRFATHINAANCEALEQQARDSDKVWACSKRMEPDARFSLQCEIQDDFDKNVRFSITGTGHKPLFEEKFEQEYESDKHPKALTDEQLERLRALAQQIKDTINEQQLINGMPLLLQMLSEDMPKSQPKYSTESRLVIDDRFRIMLMDYDVSVPMPTLSKALYILFLRHPEGIRLKEMADYREELRVLYMTLSMRTDLDAQEASIRELTNPESSSINQKLSRINRAFRYALGDASAEAYLIKGTRGERYTISLPRHHVHYPSELKQ